MPDTAHKPTVLCFSGLDPTGGAGIQADIETLFSIGCHCAPIVTALTVQNTQNVISVKPTDAALLVQQARAILEDMPVDAVKLGMLGSVGAVEVVHTLLQDYSDLPVVLDPIAAAGGGYELSGGEVLEAIANLLLPLTTVLTPNTDEARLLAPAADNLDACANEIIETGCQYVLITGTHAQSDGVINRLYAAHQQVTLYTWPRLEAVYHGSGCTLASGIAGYLSHGLTINDAVQQAQRFTWEALSHGQRMGFGQHLPERSYWNNSPR